MKSAVYDWRVTSPGFLASASAKRLLCLVGALIAFGPLTWGDSLTWSPVTGFGVDWQYGQNWSGGTPPGGSDTVLLGSTVAPDFSIAFSQISQATSIGGLSYSGTAPTVVDIVGPGSLTVGGALNSGAYSFNTSLTLNVSSSPYDPANPGVPGGSLVLQGSGGLAPNANVYVDAQNPGAAQAQLTIATGASQTLFDAQTGANGLITVNAGGALSAGTMSGLFEVSGTLSAGINGGFGYNGNNVAGAIDLFGGTVNLAGTQNLGIDGLTGTNLGQSVMFGNGTVNLANDLSIGVNSFVAVLNGNLTFNNTSQSAVTISALGSQLGLDAGNTTGSLILGDNVNLSNVNLGGSVILEGQHTLNDVHSAQGLPVAAGAVVDALTPTYMGSGTTEVDGSLTSAVTVAGGGSLQGDGTITGNVTVNDGTIKPGDSPGVLTVNGNMSLSAASTTEIQIGGTNASTPEFDIFQINGSVVLSGLLDTLLIDLTGGSDPFAPSIGQSFDFLNYTGDLTGTFGSYNQYINSSEHWALDYSHATATNGGYIALDVVAGGVAEAPEPAAWLLALGGLGPLGIFRITFGTARG